MACTYNEVKKDGEQGFGAINKKGRRPRQREKERETVCAGSVCVIKGGVCGMHCVSVWVKPEWHLPGLLWYILDAQSSHFASTVLHYA